MSSAHAAMTRAVRVHVIGLQSYEEQLLATRLRHLAVRLTFARASSQYAFDFAADYYIASKQAGHAATARAKRMFGDRFLYCARSGVRGIADTIAGLDGVRARTTVASAPTHVSAPALAQQKESTMETHTEDNTAVQDADAVLRSMIGEVPAALTHPPKPTRSAAARRPRKAHGAHARAKALWDELRPAALSDADCLDAVAAALKVKQATARVYLRAAKCLTRPVQIVPVRVPPHAYDSEWAAVTVTPTPVAPSEARRRASASMTVDLELLGELWRVYARLSPAAQAYARKAFPR